MFRTEALGLSSGLQPVYPAFDQQLLVELLQFQRSELFQRDVSDIWIDVVVDVAPVGLVGGRPHFDLGAVLKPYLHPLPYRVLSYFGQVQRLGFFNGSLQLFLDLCLGFAQHIFVDSLAGLRVMPRRVPSLPAAVLAFSNAAFTVGSFLSHMCRLLSSNTQYPNWQTIARANGQSYQNSNNLDSFLVRKTISLVTA